MITEEKYAYRRFFFRDHALPYARRLDSGASVADGAGVA
jgi:hypothetical protein